RSTSAREVDVAQHWDVLKFATPPELKCPDCSSPTTCAASEALLAHLPSLPRPDIPDELRKQVKHFQEESLKKALAAKATNGAGMSMPLVLPSGGMAAAGRGFSWLTALVAAAIVVLVGGGVILVKAIATQHAQNGPEGGEKLEASQPTRPAWVDQTFFRENDRLLFVGHSTLVSDKADGFIEAEAGPMAEATNQTGPRDAHATGLEHARVAEEGGQLRA